MIEPQEVDQFSLAADAILARPRRKKAKAVAIVDPPSVRDEALTLHFEVESIVGRMIRQIRDQEESQARTLLKAAYDAGFDDAAVVASRCCGCAIDGDGDFERFLARLLAATRHEEE